MFNFFSKSKKSKAKSKAARKAGQKSRAKTGKRKSVQKTSTAAKSQPEPPSLDPATRLAQLIVENETDADAGAPTPEPQAINASAKLDQAKAVLESGKFKTKLGSSDRKKLIRQALAIQQVQSKLLDDIDDETRRKLQNLAVDTLFRGRK